MLVEQLLFRNTKQSLLGSKFMTSFIKGLSFMRQTILDHHPGVYNAQDPKFCECLEENYRVAAQRLSEDISEEESVGALRGFCCSFQDCHLGLRYPLLKSQPQVVAKKVDDFSIKRIKDAIFWVRIPTFQPSESQRGELSRMGEMLSSLRQSTLIFDLRGNRGGNTSFARGLLQSLFTQEYFNRQCAPLSQNVYVEWRATPENLEHIRNVVIRMQREFKRGEGAIEWIESVAIGMAEACSKGERYYVSSKNVMPSEMPETKNPFSGRMIAIIDRECVSACLDFIDYLKAMKIANTLFIGETTGADSVYMDVREVALPSGKGHLVFPLKTYRNRPRGHNEPHVPNVKYEGDLSDTERLQQFVLGLLGT